MKCNGMYIKYDAKYATQDVCNAGIQYIRI